MAKISEHTLFSVQEKCRYIGRDLSFEESLKFLKWPTWYQRRLFSSLSECYKTMALDPSDCFIFANDFRPLRAKHCFKLKSASPPLKKFKYYFLCIIDSWNYLPGEIVEADNLNIYRSRLKYYLTSVLREH